MSTLTTYRTAVQLMGYDALATATIDAAVQEGRRRVITARRWSWSEMSNATLSTTSGTDNVSLSTIADLGYLDAVRLSNASGKLPLDWRPYSLIRDLQDHYGETGTPLYWTRYRGRIVLYPTPTAAYTLTVEYIATPADVASSADIIPDRHQDLVKWAAVVPLAFRQRGMTESSAADQYWTRVLLPMHAGQDALEQRQTSGQVRSGYWGY